MKVMTAMNNVEFIFLRILQESSALRTLLMKVQKTSTLTPILRKPTLWPTMKKMNAANIRFLLPPMSGIKA
jgi:hypothetical protein